MRRMLSRGLRRQGEAVERSVAMGTTSPGRPDGKLTVQMKDEKGPRPELQDPGHCKAGIRELQQKNVN